MTSRYRALALFILAAIAPTQTQAGAAPQNARLTSAYYTRLLAGPEPQIAELNVLMTLLPKGGDLHHHYSGAQYAETYLEWVDKQGFCIDRDSLRIETTPPAGDAGKNCVSAAALTADNGRYRALLQRWSDKDFDNHFHEQPAPDQQFFDTFGYFGPASGYAPAEGLRLLKARAKAENIQYLETMLQSAPAVPNPTLAAAIDALPPDANAAQVTAALTPYADFLASDAGAQAAIDDYRSRLASYASGLDDADFTLRFQTYVARTSAPSKVFAGLYAAFAAAHANSLIVGVNIVAPENNTIAMRDYGLHMQMFRFLKQRFGDVNISTHAGELTLGMVPPEGLRHHIRDAVEIAGAQRIGHGVDVTYEDQPDQLLAELAARKVAIEVNLSSNAFILGVAGAAHPVTVYARHGVPFVLSTDDAGVSRNNLSGEYLLYVTRYKPRYAQLKAVVYNSIRYAFLPAQEKTRQLRILDTRFAQFEARVARLARTSAQVAASGPATP